MSGGYSYRAVVVFRDDTLETIRFGSTKLYIRNELCIYYRRQCPLRGCEFKMHEEYACVSTGSTKTKQITAWGFEVRPHGEVVTPSENSQKGFGSISFGQSTAKSL